MTAAKGVFFDLDGTFADTAADMLAALNRMRGEAGRAPLDVGDVRLHISAGARHLLATFLFETEEEVAENRSRYLDYYEETGYAETRLFDGIAELVGALDREGVPWGIATNKPERYAAPILSQLGMDGRHVCLLCPEHCERPKPAPDMLHKAASIAGLASRDCAYVGDDPRDLQAAAAAGMRFVAAGWGYWSVTDTDGILVAGTPAEALAGILPGTGGE